MLAQQRRGRKKRSEASESSDTVTRDFGDSDELGEPEPIRPRVGSSAVKTKDGLKINLNILVDLKSPGKFAGAKSYRKLLFRENAATVEADDDGDECVPRLIGTGSNRIKAKVATVAPPFRETVGRVNDASPTTPTLTTLTTNECLLKDLIQIITFTSNNAKICKQDSLVPLLLL